LEHFITSKHGGHGFLAVYKQEPLNRKVTTDENSRNSMKKTENVNLLILGSRTDPGFITMLNKMIWSATGASKPMDQKSYIYILL
jgi:hypothetical protein